MCAILTRYRLPHHKAISPLIDTNVISEARKGRRANHGVREFLEQSAADGHALFLSVITIGELRRGVEQIRRRGDEQQAVVLEDWLTDLLADYRGHVLPVDDEIAQVWGRLRVPDAGNALDKLSAATGDSAQSRTRRTMSDC